MDDTKIMLQQLEEYTLEYAKLLDAADAALAAIHLHNYGVAEDILSIALGRREQPLKVKSDTHNLKFL